MKYLVYLHSLGLTQKELLKIFENNRNYKEVYTDFKNGKIDKYNIKNKEKIKENFKNLDIIKIDKTIENLDIKIVTIKDKKYPKYLREISSPPYFLYVRGELQENEEFFSIVGSRKISLYSKKVGENIVPKLTKYFNIVSGGAGGCDSLAHNLTLENKGKTTVIFGTGIDVTYPSSNKKLYENIIKNNGALISIFPLGTPGNIYTFPIRNEIVAGMSKGILVLQAGEKSGTLITANLALDNGRDLFATPGDIFSPDYIGTNELIKNSNAKLVTKYEDILEEYNYKIIKEERIISFQNKIEENIYNLLKYNLSLSVDDFLEKTIYSYQELSLNISMMEISGIIKKDNFGKYYIS